MKALTRQTGRQTGSVVENQASPCSFEEFRKLVQDLINKKLKYGNTSSWQNRRLGEYFPIRAKYYTIGIRLSCA